MVCGTMRAVDSSSAASSKRRIDTSRSCVPDHGRLAFPSTALSGACDAVIACSRRARVAIGRPGQLNDGVPNRLKERVPIHSEREPPFW